MKNGYSICFNEWALDKSIKSELGLLLIVSSLTAEQGYCYASNEYFSRLFGMDEVTISRKLKKLEKKGYITITYIKKGCEIVKREIRLTKMLTDDSQKRQSTINKNVKEKITSVNTLSVNNDPPLTPPYGGECYTTFEEFWKMYIPVKCTDGRFTDKGSKQQAYKAFKKALQKDNIENIKAGLIRYLHKKSKTDSMTANVSTFLNQERWKDEPEQTFILSEKSQKQQKEDSGQEMYEMFQRFIKED